jgi:hypothetical protein
MLQAWRDALDFAHERFGTTLYLIGIAEDGILGYYAAANDPRVSAMTLHTLIERGDPASLGWLGGSRMIQLKQAGARLLSLVRPTYRIRGTSSVPWEDIFAGPGDAERRQMLSRDPLSFQWTQARFGASFIARRKPPVPFESCKTPIQIVASELNRHWPIDLMEAECNRLAGPTEFVRLEGRPHWELNREFQELYCSHAIRWFRTHCAMTVAEEVSNA